MLSGEDRRLVHALVVVAEDDQVIVRTQAGEFTTDAVVVALRDDDIALEVCR